MNSQQEIRIVSLKNGQFMTIDMTPEFYPNLRKRFDLAPDEFVSDEHIRMFVFGAVKTAIDKAENEQKDP